MPRVITLYGNTSATGMSENVRVCMDARDIYKVLTAISYNLNGIKKRLEEYETISTLQSQLIYWYTMREIYAGPANRYFREMFLWLPRDATGYQEYGGVVENGLHYPDAFAVFLALDAAYAPDVYDFSTTEKFQYLRRISFMAWHHIMLLLGQFLSTLCYRLSPEYSQALIDDRTARGDFSAPYTPVGLWRIVKQNTVGLLESAFVEYFLKTCLQPRIQVFLQQLLSTLTEGEIKHFLLTLPSSAMYSPHNKCLIYQACLDRLRGAPQHVLPDLTKAYPMALDFAYDSSRLSREDTKYVANF